MNLLIQPSSSRSACSEEQVLFRFQDLELTRNTMIMRFLDEEMVIPLKEIAAYHLKWYLHDPTSAEKYWFLVLTVELTDGREESGPIVVAEFSHAEDEHQLREDIEGNLAEAIDLARSWHDAPLQTLNTVERDGAYRPSIAGLN